MRQQRGAAPTAWRAPRVCELCPCRESAALPGRSRSRSASTIPQPINLLYTERGQPARNGGREGLQGQSWEVSSTGTVCSGCSCWLRALDDFQRPRPRSLHPLLLHVGRGEPAHLWGDRKGELGAGSSRGTAQSCWSSRIWTAHGIVGVFCAWTL